MELLTSHLQPPLYLLKNTVISHMDMRVGDALVRGVSCELVWMELQQLRAKATLNQSQLH